MVDELLNKTGAGNLLMVFGEPDTSVEPHGDEGHLIVAVHGVDVYDPTTGQIRNSSTDDIACWFIDTNYNGESFFVRHAYFTGGDEPCERLKRALRADIDEAAWSALFSTVSRPFAPLETGKIAVKVINHYGDEVKVYESNFFFVVPSNQVPFRILLRCAARFPSVFGFLFVVRSGLGPNSGFFS
jgi:adenine-specific DNA-methyltransferase